MTCFMFDQSGLHEETGPICAASFVGGGLVSIV